ncbi:putative metalloprotease CJM1_0395 family protein [Chitinibacter sp. S2-10]|uniref:putative metalloprotease CJM1_0395 family protein n=1 Tax=Chitinibacter sp. S2-10 TaxID=3373597 RepID=UPI003977D958
MEASISSQPRAANGEPLTEQQQAQIDELKRIDAKVRSHERAHLTAAAGIATSGASYTLKTGPDGKQYAVGGEVQIDISPGQTPEETIRKARIIRAAALAPADPSGQDQAVAAQAQAMEMQANLEIAQRSPEQSRLASAYGQNDLPIGVFEGQA